MKRLNWKELGIDILVDLVAGLLIALGVYNIALNANFPVEGFSGISIILHHLFGLPIGVSLFLLNIPAAIFSFRLLGKTFFLKSIKSTVITSLIMDYIAPLLPVYNGSCFLAALSMGVLCGIGYAMIFMRGSSTGGQDFISVPIKKMMPHVTLGAINIVQDVAIIILGTVLVFHDMDGLIYGIISTYVIAVVYVSFGTGERSWVDAQKYGFISAGGGTWYSNTLKLLSPGDRVWVNIPHTGYVGVGTVRKEVQQAKDVRFSIDGQQVGFSDLHTEADYLYSSEDPINAEYVVLVDWIKTVPESQAVKEIGFFGNQNSVCRPRD